MSYLTSQFKRAFKKKQNEVIQDINDKISGSSNPFKGILTNKLINFLPVPPVVKLLLKHGAKKSQSPFSKIDTKSPFLPKTIKNKIKTANKEYIKQLDTNLINSLINEDMIKWNNSQETPFINQEDLKQAYFEHVGDKYSLENIFSAIGNKITNWRK